MEYFPLGDLQKYMTQLFREREAQQITFQLLESLDFMHSNGFTHGDLKPQVCSSHVAFDSTLLISRRIFS
jgi:serine/threonine protein kinase